MKEGFYKTEHQGMMPNLAIEERACEVSAGILTHVVSDQFVIWAKTKNFYYNVIGPRAPQFRELFKEQACCLMKEFECLADNLRGLGHKVPNMVEKLKAVSIELPREGEWPSDDQMVRILLNDHERLLQQLTRDADRLKDVHDKAIEDLIFHTIREHRVLAHKLRDVLDTRTQF
jgi:starvation-inducible DNA-binding protein